MSTSSEVYAAGIVIWELFSEKAPYLGLNNNEAAEMIVSGNTPKLDVIPTDIATLLTECWLQNPQKRPSFASMLSEIKKTL